MKKVGQITIPFAVGMTVIAGLSSYFGVLLSTQKERAAISERTARLETSIPAIREDISDIKHSLTSIQNSLIGASTASTK